MWFTIIYSNNQKYIGTSIKVGCATRSLYASSCPKAEGVPTNNQSRRGSGPCRLWGGLDKARHIVPTALLVRVQCLRNNLYKALKGPITRPIVLSMIAGQLMCFNNYSLFCFGVLICKNVNFQVPSQFFNSDLKGNTTKNAQKSETEMWKFIYSHSEVLIKIRDFRNLIKYVGMPLKSKEGTKMATYHIHVYSFHINTFKDTWGKVLSNGMHIWHFYIFFTTGKNNFTSSKINLTSS